MAVLDTMKVSLEEHQGAYVVHYHILDSDEHGRPPNCPKFDYSEKSCLDIISNSNNKVIMIYTSLCLVVITSLPDYILGCSVS